MATVEWSRFSCPHCKGSLSRVRRHLGDRTVSLLVPVVRLHCDVATCQWEGIRAVAKPA
jgi:hypothetical protein